MNARTAQRVSAALGFLAVALGAFGAHGLKPVLEANHMLAVWEKAVFYHLIHAVMLYLLATRTPFRPCPWYCFLAGILIFSGSLYLLAFTSVRWLGAITPFGGVSFLVGWFWLILAPGDAPSKT